MGPVTPEGSGHYQWENHQGRQGRLTASGTGNRQAGQHGGGTADHDDGRHEPRARQSACQEEGR
eukprot:15917405-Heterocapsa_arctica.AAC.1